MTEKKCGATCACRDEARALELARLDALQVVLWPAAEAGNAQAMEKVLDIVDKRCRLLDLYAPRKVTFTNMDGKKPYVFPKGNP